MNLNPDTTHGASSFETKIQTNSKQQETGKFKPKPKQHQIKCRAQRAKMSPDRQVNLFPLSP